MTQHTIPGRQASPTLEAIFRSHPDFAAFVAPYGDLYKVDAFGYLQQAARKAQPAEKTQPAEKAQLAEQGEKKRGAVVLVTADTPLKASRGEGKTTTTIALIDALRARGVDAAAVLRQPSMGITAAGSKGGASGGGKASLAHAQLADWGLTGEMSRIADAQNLLVAFCEKAVDDGILDRILIPRVSEIPSRSLRRIAVDAGKLEEKTVITPASEMMQIVVLSRSQEEVNRRVREMIAGTKAGKPVMIADFVDVDRIVNVLGNALQPAYMETVQGSPVYIHCGPFANVSLGIPGLAAVDLACALHDLVVVEAGYGADAGAQKWIDVAAREYGAQWPAAAVVVTRASTWQDDPALRWRYPFHVRRLEGLGIPTFPLINLWEGEDSHIPALRQTAQSLGFRQPMMGNLFRDGGEGIANQLDDFLSAISAQHQSSISISQDSSSRKGRPIMDNLSQIISEAYGVPAERIKSKDGFDQSLHEARDLAAQAGLNLDDLAVCAIKSPATMTDNDALPEGQRTVTLKKVSINAGSGIVGVNLTTSLTTPMPKIV